MIVTHTNRSEFSTTIPYRVNQLDDNFIDCNYQRLNFYDFVLVRGAIGLVLGYRDDFPTFRLFQNGILTDTIYTFPVSEICLLEFNKVPSAYWEIRSKLYGERNGIRTI